MTNHKIWPGPECLDGVDVAALVAPGSRGREARSRRFVSLTFELGSMPAPHQLAIEAQRGREIVARTRGIGEGGALRLRHQRFVQWLRGYGARLGPSPSLAHDVDGICLLASASPTPETFVRGLDRPWSPIKGMYRAMVLEMALPGVHSLYWPATDRLVTSSAWASLPWQRDPSEVGHA